MFVLTSSEVTKVRRNLFNQEEASPSKRSRLPRSRSVSAVEGPKRKRRDSESEGKIDNQSMKWIIVDQRLNNENGADDYSSRVFLSLELFVSFREA